MNGPENTNAVELLEKVYDEVTSIASDMAKVHATKKAVDKKAMVIGKALIEQKQTTEQIQKNQTENQRLIQKAQEETDEKWETVAGAVRNMAQAVADLQSTDVQKTALLHSLSQLSDEQRTFMKKNREFSKKADDDLNLVRKTILNMREIIEHMDIEDQTAFVHEKVEIIRTAIASYMESRLSLINAMAQQIETTEKQITEITEQMSSQTKAVEQIAAISSEYGDKTNQMCQLLEELLSEVRQTSQSETLSLEEVFGDDEPDPSEYAEDLPDEDLLDEELRDDDDSTEDEDLSEDEDLDSDIYILDEEENQAKHIRRRKRGLWNRLFGGR